jgi:hypothetical protein
VLVVGGPVATGALSWVLFEVGVGLDRLLAIVGVALTLVIYIAQEFRPFRRRSRRIVFVGRSTSLFTRNILAGFQERTRDEFPCSLTTLLPTEMHEKEDLSFQIDCLRSETAGRADAIVIVPVRDHPSLWQELGRLAVRGVFIVVVDVKAPNRYFYQQRIHRRDSCPRTSRRAGSWWPRRWRSTWTSRVTSASSCSDRRSRCRAGSGRAAACTAS